ncbi:MAG: hypothetical protein F4W91_05590 [Gemmatimonadetes bacterium]|nr:hypothetical protein [Gemmatimonadota bacterium]
MFGIVRAGVTGGCAGVNDPVVIGIVRDFHIKSLHNRIEPLALLMEKYNYGPFLLIRMRPGQIFETIGMLKNTWEKVAPNMPFELSFLDENLNRQYANEVYWFRVLSHSALVAVLLSCLGLFGLASLAVARRTKEIGIRKVLGLLSIMSCGCFPEILSNCYWSPISSPILLPTG